MKFVVIDELGNASYSLKTEGPEAFKTLKAAEKRAVELSKTAPGEAIRIYALHATIVARVSAPEWLPANKPVRPRA